MASVQQRAYQNQALVILKNNENVPIYMSQAVNHIGSIEDDKYPQTILARSSGGLTHFTDGQAAMAMLRYTWLGNSGEPLSAIVAWGALYDMVVPTPNRVYKQRGLKSVIDTVGWDDVLNYFKIGESGDPGISIYHQAPNTAVVVANFD